MEVNLKREAIQYCTPVYSDTLSREETLETVVSDTHGYGELTLKGVFEKSSNIGFAKAVNKYYKDKPEKFVEHAERCSISARIRSGCKGSKRSFRSAFPRRQRARRIPIYLPRISAYRRRTPGF